MKLKRIKPNANERTTASWRDSINLLIEEGYESCDYPGNVHIGNASSELNLEPVFLERLLSGKEDIGCTLAYRLAKIIKGTDVAFWLKLQNDYDCYEINVNFQKKMVKIMEHESSKIEDLE